MHSALDDLTLLREYEPRELGGDGYPEVWHRGLVREHHVTPQSTAAWGSAQGVGHAVAPPSALGVKHLVREAAGHRCERCGHPYAPGCGTWTEGTATHPPEANGGRDERGESLGWASMAFWPEDDEPVDGGDAIRKKRTLWSPCDERCTHGGPIRVELPDGWHVVEGGDVRGWDVTAVRVQAAWRILTVHHLNGRKHDLRWWNLAALCQRCHLHIQRKVVMERVWPAEHTEWFRPHAAGWYAYAYLGENLTRSETLERLDELLGLELAGA